MTAEYWFVFNAYSVWWTMREKGKGGKPPFFNFSKHSDVTVASSRRYKIQRNFNFDFKLNSYLDPDMDAFAQIATRNISTDRLPLHTPKPPVLPECLLPLTDRRPGPPFRRMERIDDAAGLEALLDRLRTTHAPFLECHAPPPPFIRPNQPIESFDWRLEEPGDAADFNRIMKGEGSWEQITIPHYGGPVGRATTWYRNVFTPTPALLASPRQWIHFEGADYKAQVFLNGNFIGAHEGMFAPFDFDLTDTLCPGENVLVVKVLNECPFMGYEVGGRKQMGDKVYAATGVGWDDPELGWHHCPPGMGIYRKVWLEGRAHCFVDDIFVRPEASLDGAELWIDLFNSGLEEQPLQIELSCFGENFKATVFVDQTMVTQAGPSLNYIRTTFPLPDARIWNLDRPWLYRVRVVVKDAGGRVLDCAERPWGMRHFSQDIENEPKGRFFLNGRSIRLRGANTMGFEQLSVARGNFDLLRDDLLRAKACHMNFLRLTQRPVEREVYDICDRLGLLVQTDLPLFGVVRRNQANECVRQAEEMERFVRNHPSCVVISYINEPFPDALDAPHRHLLRDELEGFFLSADQSVRRQNPDRVIKAVDGDYDPPAPGLPDNHIYNTWYNGHGVELGRFYRGYWLPVKPGWCYGCGEFGAEGLEDLSLMRRLYPPAWLPEKDDDPSWTPANIVFAQSHNFC